MQVNSAPQMVHDVIRNEGASACCKVTACAIFCLPCFLGCLCWTTVCSDEGELKKMDKRKLKLIETQLDEMTVSETDLKGLDGDKKIAKIREQILGVRKIADEFKSLQSSGYKSMFEDAPTRLNKLLDEMIDGDDILKNEKEALGVKKKDDILSFLEKRGE